jgi:flagellar biosynthesis/type III secretory pathway M-ring protein FliF/YscJ
VDGKRAPRSDAEIERIKRLVASASGIRAERDELEVLQVPFDPNLGMGADTAGGQTGTGTAARPAVRSLPWSVIAGGVALAVAVVLFVLWRARRRRQAIFGAVTAAFGPRDPRAELSAAPAAVAGAHAVSGAPAAAVAAAPVTAEAVAPLEMKTKFPEKEVLKERVLAAAREHPEEIAQILRAWISKRRVTT